jgi:hypothetical protein
MTANTGIPDPLFQVLRRMGLLEFDDVDREARALSPDQAGPAARLLVACLEAHHRVMVRRLAAKIGEGLQEFNTLREAVGLDSGP